MMNKLSLSSILISISPSFSLFAQSTPHSGYQSAFLINEKILHQTRRSSWSLCAENQQLCASHTVDFDSLSYSTSLSNVNYPSVLRSLDELYPPQGIQMRNAASRADGYWTFISEGKEPPPDFTYGEFDLEFFAYLLDRSHYHYYSSSSVKNTYEQKDWSNKVFADIGSGAGRLILGAASLHPVWKLCKGIEVLPGLHKLGVEAIQKCYKNEEEKDAPNANSESMDSFTTERESEKYVLKSSESADLALAPIQLSCASVLDPKEYIGDIDCAFVFSSAMSKELLTNISAAVGRQCKPGTVVITTDYMLELNGWVKACEDDNREGHYSFRLLESIDGPCSVVGGITTAYIHEVVESLWEEP